MNLFVVVETGDHHISVLDGDRFEVLDRFPTPIAVHGGPKFSPDGRFVFVMSRDGWVQKYDLWSLAEVGRVRAGLNSRNIAISKRRQLARRRQLPARDADDPRRRRPLGRPRHRRGGPRRHALARLRRLPGARRATASSSRSRTRPRSGRSPPTRTRRRCTRASSTATRPAWRRRSAPPRASSPCGASPLAEPLDDFFFTPDYRHLIGASRSGDRGIVVNLTRRPRDRRAAAAGHAAPRLGHHLDARRPAGDGDPAPAGAAPLGDRHRQLGGGGHGRRPAAPASSCAATKRAPTSGPTPSSGRRATPSTSSTSRASRSSRT